MLDAACLPAGRDAGYWIPDARYRMPPACRQAGMPDARQMPDARCQMPDAG